MKGKALTVCAAAALALAIPGEIHGQDGASASVTWQAVQVEDIRTMHEKFRGLAEAFDQAQYDWRPMEGVRSVREVLGLTVAEAHLFPTAWGYEAPSSSAPGFEAEMERASTLSREEMLRDLDVSFTHLLGVVQGMTEEERQAPGSYFGRAMPVHASIATAMADMHEHLGQLIAYARTNQVVPPWSR